MGMCTSGPNARFVYDRRVDSHKAASNSVALLLASF